ncbi:hypothetical protein [Streptomyces sp. CBMA123]|uniref:hypothetical protein n=1 Tax=Streptomyces sp. CBMA123 TaxID=1896313 RepID=UPI001661AB9E|nr:hypothetical protein [Streptomyces sp. CBMA123]
MKKNERANAPDIVRITHRGHGVCSPPVLIGLPGSWRDPDFEAKAARKFGWRTWGGSRGAHRGLRADGLSAGSGAGVVAWAGARVVVRRERDPRSEPNSPDRAGVHHGSGGERA